MQKRIISAVLSAAMLGTSVFSVPFVNAKTAVETGDIDASGIIDVSDLSELSLALLGDRNLSEDQKKAADVDGDGEVTLADLARIRQFISKKISRCVFCGITLTDIVDTSIRDNIATSDAMEEFYEDNVYIYEFGSIVSELIECTFSDGTVMNVRKALAEGMISISDLDKFNIRYSKREKKLNEFTAEVAEISENRMIVIPDSGFYYTDKVIVHCKQIISELSINAGDKVCIEYSGGIMESNPPQVVASRISILEKASDEVEYSFTPISVRVTVDHSIDEYPQHQMITDRAGFDALFTEKQELEIEESGGKLAKLNGKYTDEWFEAHKLYVAYPGVGGPTSTRYKVEKVTNKEVTIYQNLLGQSMSPTEELADWIIFIEVSRDADVTEATEIKFNTVY